MTPGKLNDQGAFVYPDDEPLVWVDALMPNALHTPLNMPDEIVVVDDDALPHEIVITRGVEKGNPPTVRTRRGFAWLNDERLSDDERQFRPEDRLQVGGLTVRCLEVQPGVFQIGFVALPERIVNALTNRARFRWTVSANTVERDQPTR